MQSVMRERQFNMRMSDEEWVRMERIAHHYATSAPDLFRLLLLKEDEALGGRKARITEFHKDILRALRDADGPKGAADLINPVSAHHSMPYIGNEIYRALLELFEHRMVSRAAGAGAAWSITDDGRECLKKHR